MRFEASKLRLVGWFVLLKELMCVSGLGFKFGLGLGMIMVYWLLG